MSDSYYDAVSKMSDEDLDKLSDEDVANLMAGKPLKGAAPPMEAAGKMAQQGMLAAVKDRAAIPDVDTSEGMSNFDLARAGLAKTMFVNPARGIEELGVAAFGSPEEIKRHNVEKAAQQKIDDRLMNNWAAKAGGFAGNAGTAMMGPARLGPQMAVAGIQSALSPSDEPVTGLGSELATRGIQGLQSAAATGAVALPIGMVGKAVGANRRMFSPRDLERMQGAEAARRIGINPTIGQLDPTGIMRGFEGGSGYARMVNNQTNKLEDALGRPTTVPTSNFGESVGQTARGEGLRQELVAGGKEAKRLGSDMWKQLDDYVVQNGVAPVKPAETSTAVADVLGKYTPVAKKTGQPNYDKNPVMSYVADYDPEAAKLLQSFSGGSNTASFTEIHELQTAVGSALNRARFDAQSPNASKEAKDAARELSRLYGSLNRDVDGWATDNPAAGQMRDHARDFWRKVVVPGTINNKEYVKAARGEVGGNYRGYKDSNQMVSRIAGNLEGFDPLKPYMSDLGKDYMTTLKTLPEVTKAFSAGGAGSQGRNTALQEVAALSAGSPYQQAKTLLGHVSGLNNLTKSPAVQRFAFAQNAAKEAPTDAPLAKLARRSIFGAARYPAESVEGPLSKFTGVRLKP